MSDDAVVKGPAPEKHHRFGGSSCHRWLECSVSTSPLAGVKEESSDAAEEGTRCHALAAEAVEYVFFGEGESQTIEDPEMALAVRLYLEAVERATRGDF